MNDNLQLAEFSVKGLFGLFDHDIKLNLRDRISIIHAPNGYGKTVILKLISGFFGGSLGIFRRVEFDHILYKLTDGTSIRLERRTREGKNGRGKETELSLVVKRRKGGKVTNEWEGWGAPLGENRRAIPPGALERLVPHHPFLRIEV